MSSGTGTFKSEIRSLSSEILLKIFLNLDCHETVILRSVCKEFLEVIDNNKSLWRILDWVQEESGSAVRALEKFDDKSGSTLKEVFIFQGEEDPDNRFLKVLHRSRNTLLALSFKLPFHGGDFCPKLISLASNAPLLKSLVLWPSTEYWVSRFPKVRLIHRSRECRPDFQRSSDLQAMWCFNAEKVCEGKLEVSSLISFADPFYHGSLQTRSFISNFSSTLFHLSIHLDEGVATPTLSCPSLRILEGRLSDGFPSWLDAPNLQIVIARDIDPRFLRQLLISVKELWLLSWFYYSTETDLDFLSQACPQLKILKLAKEIFCGHLNSKSRDILETLKVRDERVREGVEIEGIKMMSLEKLILPIELFRSAEVDQLRDLVGEVIDIEDYPDFIELEY